MYKIQLATSQLGETGLEITRVGFGAWALGGTGKGYEWAWGAQDDEDSVAAIEHALELGVNWIDTAAEYGLGHSEEVVGRALRDLHDRPYVFTKAGRVAAGEGHIVSNLKRDSILREAEASRARLGVEAIDLYQIHWPTEDLEEGWAALDELKEEGLVRHIGISNVDVEQLRRIQSVAPVETLQLPYSLVAREADEELLPFAEQEGIGVIVYSPMGSGLLAGSMSRERLAGLPENDWRKHDDRFREPKLSRGLAIAERLEDVAERLDTSPGAVAVAWTLRNPAVDGAIVGFRRPDQVDPILAAANLELGEDDIATIEGRTGDGHDDRN